MTSERANDAPAAPPSQTENGETNLIPLHIAEYTALTNRNTYWLTLQFAVWPIVLLYVGLVTSAWNQFAGYHSELLWLSAVIIQIAILSWFQCGQEIYTNVRYLESTLRPIVKSLVKNSQFWQYEEFLARRRGALPKPYETWPIALSATGLLIVGLTRDRWTLLDSAGALVNGVLFLGTVVSCVGLVRTRHCFWQPA